MICQFDTLNSHDPELYLGAQHSENPQNRKNNGVNNNFWGPGVYA